MILLGSCQTNVCYQKSIDLPNSWHRDSSLVFEIPQCNDSVDVILLIQNSYSFKFSNLFVKTQIKDDKAVLIKELNELFLMDAKTGKPLGKGSGSYYAHEFRIYSGLKFDNNSHKLIVNHFMRDIIVNDITKVGVKLVRNKRK